MKREAQTIEYKSSWHEDYFGWIAGYANASGGTTHEMIGAELNNFLFDKVGM